VHLEPSVDEISPHRLDIRIGKIVEVMKHPDADALYIEKIDVGKLKAEIVITYSSFCIFFLKIFVTLFFSPPPTPHPISHVKVELLYCGMETTSAFSLVGLIVGTDGLKIFDADSISTWLIISRDFITSHCN
jgi:hypothetical protein